MDLSGIVSDLRYLVMPFLAFIAVGALALVLRWSQTPRKRRRTSRPRGLLVPIARVPSQAAAERVASRLHGHGIRTTSAATPTGVDVLVWEEEYGEARLYVREPDEGSGSAG
ncbi:MAG TPA: hypothetical protein VK059_00745 [Nocardioidaceae bacterium]|nr:hypothetical protein [Nocardioidaceae bacterium]